MQINVGAEAMAAVRSGRRRPVLAACDPLAVPHVPPLRAK